MLFLSVILTQDHLVNITEVESATPMRTIGLPHTRTARHSECSNVRTVRILKGGAVHHESWERKLIWRFNYSHSLDMLYALAWVKYYEYFESEIYEVDFPVLKTSAPTLDPSVIFLLRLSRDRQVIVMRH